MRRLVFLPFSIRCDSESSVALAVSSTSSKQSKGDGSADENLKIDKRQSLPKASFTQGISRLIRRFKTFSQFFVYKEEVEYTEKEMEIGFPTDVKHVTHIGSDGSTTVNPVSNWGNHLKPSEINLSFPCISLHQFEAAMAAQSHS